MSLTKYERKNSIKCDVTFQTGGVDTDPSGNKVYLSVIRPDNTYLYSSVSATRTDTGDYRYYISTNSSDPLGIYRIEWKGWHDVGGSQGNLPIIQRDAFSIVDTEQ